LGDRRYSDEAAFLNPEVFAAPMDAAGGKSSNPDHEGNGVAQWDEPKFAPKDFVAQAPNPCGPSHYDAEDEVPKRKGGGDAGRWRDQGCDYRPRQAMREEQADVGGRSAETYGTSPAQLVPPETARRLRRIHGPDNFRGQDNAAAGFGDAISELVIVGEPIGHRGEAADFG